MINENDELDNIQVDNNQATDKNSTNEKHQINTIENNNNTLICNLITDDT